MKRPDEKKVIPTPQNNDTNPLLNLPADVYQHILPKLDIKTLGRVARTSKRLRHLSSENWLWKQKLKQAGVELLPAEDINYKTYYCTATSPKFPIQEPFQPQIDMTQESYQTLKILLIGEKESKKSTILNKFCNNSANFLSFGLDFNSKFVAINNHKVKLQIWDTAGQERYRAITKSYFRGAHGVVLAFNCEDMNSFLKVKQWFDICRQQLPENVKMILVGVYEDKSKIKVDNFAIEQLVKTLKLDCLLVNLTSGENLDHVFTQLATNILSEDPKFQTETKTQPQPEQNKNCNIM